jgi:hypothetical protein
MHWRRIYVAVTRFHGAAVDAFDLGKASVASQEKAGNIFARGGVDHDEIYLTFRPVVNLIEAVRIKLLINQNRSGVDCGLYEFQPDRLRSSLRHQ